MTIVINDLSCGALLGQTLGKAARLNHSHVGYLCRGHGICQTCYVTVLQGRECLSPLSEIEHAFLSERQIFGGGRLACQAVIEHDGPVTILSRPEEVRRLLLSNPLALFTYGADMGRDTASRIFPGIANLAGRIVRGEVSTKDSPGDILEAADTAMEIAVNAGSQVIPFMGLQPARKASVAVEPVVLKASPSPAPVVPSAPVVTASASSVKKSDQPVYSLEGIDDENGVKLIAAGVTSLDQLLQKGCDKRGRKELSVATGIIEDTLLRMVNRADLARVKGVGTTYVELLEAVGVFTLFELAQRNPVNLSAKMQGVNKLKKLVHLIPSVDQVKEWISQAKKLPRMVIF
jgi:chlorosome envelope protein I